MTAVTEERPATGTGSAGAPRYQSDTIAFAPHPAVVASARLRTRRALRAWNLEELADDATQVVSELISNGIEAHRREQLTAPVRLTLLGGLRTLLIVVRDASSAPPVLAPAVPDLDGECGRGLSIVDVLSADWNVKPAPGGGKTVRALLRGARRD